MTGSRDWAVITGASNGIGKAFVEECARHKINVVLAARNGAKLAALAAHLEKQYGIKTVMYAGDLTRKSSVEELVQTVQEAKLRVRYLINNAGFGQYGAFTSTNWQNEKSMIELNVVSEHSHPLAAYGGILFFIY